MRRRTRILIKWVISPANLKIFMVLERERDCVCARLEREKEGRGN